MFLSLDGEAIILKETFYPELLELFKESSIDCADRFDFGTGLHQSSYIGPCFRGSKKRSVKLFKFLFQIYKVYIYF